MQRTALESEIGNLLGDPSHSRWSTTVLRTRIELAQQDVQTLTNAVKTIETLTPTADTKEVDINDDVIDITRVTLTDADGNVHILDGKSRSELDFENPDWENEGSGKPRHFMYDASNNQLILYPKPSTNYAQTDGLKVWEVQIPTALTGDSSEPFEAVAAMQTYAMSVVHWVVSQCFMDNGTPESLAKAKFHKSNDPDNPGEFEKVVKKINAKFNAPTSIPGRILWAPQGGRIGSGIRASKEYPFG